MDNIDGMARDYLNEPYSRILIPDHETGTYTAKISEFPGCVTQGDTPEEAYRNLEAVAESWIQEVLEAGGRVPEPASNNQYGGRVALRLPKSLHKNAAQLAELEGTSLNQFLVAAVAEKVGAGNLYQGMIGSLDQRIDHLAANTITKTIGGLPNVSTQLIPSAGIIDLTGVSALSDAVVRWMPSRTMLTEHPEGLAGASNG